MTPFLGETVNYNSANLRVPPKSLTTPLPTIFSLQSGGSGQNPQVVIATVSLNYFATLCRFEIFALLLNLYLYSNGSSRYSSLMYAIIMAFKINAFDINVISNGIH